MLSDPPLFAFVPEATERLAAQRAELEEALRDGRAGGAASRPGSAGAWTATALERARAAHRGFFADYAGLATWSASRRELRALDRARRRPHRPVDAAPRRRPQPTRSPRCCRRPTRASDGDMAAAARALLR